MEYSSQVTDLHNKLERQETDAELKMDQVLSENAAVLSDLKQQLRDQTVTATNLRLNMDTLEEKFAKEKELCTQTMTKLDSTSSTLFTCEMELRKVNDLFTKTSEKLTKAQDKNQRYEKKMESEIEQRVGDVIKEKEEMKKTLEETESTFAEKDATIEKLRLLVAKKKSEFEKEQEEHKVTKEDLERQGYKVK